MMTNPIPDTAAEPDEHRLFVLENASGMTVAISERDASLRSWRAPDRYGRMANVLLADAGIDAHAGAAAAPVRWRGHLAEGGVSLLAARGDADMLVNYHLDDDGSLIINYQVVAASPVPLQANAYPCFNLNGGIAGVDDHMLRIEADYYVEVDADGAPVGVAAVGRTPFDFRQPAPIGPRLRWLDSQIRLAGGFDHCFFVRSHYTGGQCALREVACVFDPGSGRRLQLYSTEAALQFFSGDRDAGAPARPHRHRDGFGLEPNARPSLQSVAWPRVMLNPGEVYRQTTVYRISLQD
ncbi:aldose epimerase family protein [Pseudoduganella namucuonensis]|uniref:Aldose 1-epimerase n=1 Tax=Pseudoduganella namucuonensis TaxID=1035707 RepID=A0A1I7LHK9_9BURK|nr:hypothetical protein [Pseudoduganella namucuonensis]SFV09104.1 aldose 1-epimerase [Pseudoduganella namucuonensis]